MRHNAVTLTLLLSWLIAQIFSGGAISDPIPLPLFSDETPAPRGDNAPSQHLVQAQEIAPLEASMAKFVEALKNKDTDTFLTLFSQSTPWQYISTITDTPEVSIVKYAELARDLKLKDQSGWHEILFDASGDDCFRKYVMLDNGAPWKRINDVTFSPPGSDPNSRVYVKWRKEEGKWVIDTIAEPSA
jgi:hypothetical protein